MKVLIKKIRLLFAFCKASILLNVIFQQLYLIRVGRIEHEYLISFWTHLDSLKVLRDALSQIHAMDPWLYESLDTCYRLWRYCFILEGHVPTTGCSISINKNGISIARRAISNRISRLTCKLTWDLELGAGYWTDYPYLRHGHVIILK